MPTFEEEQRRIGHELNAIEAILRAALKKTLVGRWLARVFLRVKQ